MLLDLILIATASDEREVRAQPVPQPEEQPAQLAQAVVQHPQDDARPGEQLGGDEPVIGVLADIPKPAFLAGRWSSAVLRATSTRLGVGTPAFENFRPLPRVREVRKLDPSAAPISTAKK